MLAARNVLRGATPWRCDPNGNQSMAPLVQQNSILAVPATNIRVQPVASSSLKLNGETAASASQEKCRKARVG
jgi:hypothetical protein